MCAACNSCSRRATCASSARTFASSGLRSAGFAPRFFEANFRSEPLRRALRQAVRCELYNPSRRSSRPTSPRCVQRSASSRIRSRYSAVNWRRFGLATTSGSGVGLARPALGASSLRSSTPRAGRETSFNVIASLSTVISLHLHRPTVIPKVAGVSVMLAERGEVPLMFAALCRLDSGRYAPCVQLAMRSEDRERITPRPAGWRPRPAVGGAADPGGRASGSCSRGC